MSRYTNPSGYVKYDNEKELCDELEKHFLPGFFDGQWKPLLDITKEVWLNETDRIDYVGLKNNKKTYLEVKNWFVTLKDMRQIYRYKRAIEKGSVVLICGGIDKTRHKILQSLEINVIITRDIQEINPEVVVHWM